MRDSKCLGTNKRLNLKRFQLLSLLLPQLMVRESLQQGARLDKSRCLVPVWHLPRPSRSMHFGDYHVTQTHRPRGIRSIRDWAKEAALLTQAATFLFFLQLKRVGSITLLHKALY